jgi:hypothetical protein
VLPSEQTIENAVLKLDASKFQQLAERYGAMTWPERFSNQLIQGRNADGKTIAGWPDSYALTPDGGVDALEATTDQRNWRRHLTEDLERAKALPGPGLGGFAFIASAPTPEPSKLAAARQALNQLGVTEDRQSFVFRQSLVSDLRSGRFAPLWSSLLGITVSALPFVDLRKASIYGTGKATQFIPTRAEYENRSVVFPPFAETVQKRLSGYRFAFVHGRWASGKTALATCLGWDRLRAGLPVYYVDLADPAATGLEFVSRSSEAIITRGDVGVMFIVDNVHQGEAAAQELHEQWRAADTGAELLFLGRRAESAVLMKGINPPLGDLVKVAFELRVDRETLCGVYERMQAREGKDVPEVPYLVQRRWLGLFGGDLIAFSAALARADVGPSNWTLDPNALRTHLHQRYLRDRTAAEQRALCIVADRSALELGTPEHLVSAEAVTPALEDGLLERRNGEIRTVHPGLGDLIVSAAGANLGDFASLVGSAAEGVDFGTSIITVRRLALRGQTEVAGATLRRWIATGKSLHDILLVMGEAVISTRIILLQQMLGEETTLKLLDSPDGMRSFIEAAPLEDLIGLGRASTRRFSSLYSAFETALDETLSASLDIERLAAEAAARPRSLPLVSRHLKQIQPELQESLLRCMVASGAFAACIRASAGYKTARWRDLIDAASDFDFVEAELIEVLASDPDLTFRLLLYRGKGGGVDLMEASASSPLVLEALLGAIRSDQFHQTAVAEALGYGVRKLASLVELAAQFDPEFLPELDALAVEKDTIHARLKNSRPGPKSIRRLLGNLDARCPALHGAFSKAVDDLGLQF